jgi:hypothetical protein
VVCYLRSSSQLTYSFSEEFSEEEFSDGNISDSDDEMDTTDQTTRQEAMDNLVPSLPQTEYGQMPQSFYVNSQPVARTTVETHVVEGPSAGLCKKPIRAPIIPRDKYDGVDSDDETDSEVDEQDEEDSPQIVGEEEVDMGEEEEEFVEFSRKALGLSDEQWDDIIRERKGRGGETLFYNMVII